MKSGYRQFAYSYALSPLRGLRWPYNLWNVKGMMKITGSGIIPEPKNVVDALMGDRGEEWVKSIHVAEQD